MPVSPRDNNPDNPYTTKLSWVANKDRYIRGNWGRKMSKRWQRVSGVRSLVPRIERCRRTRVNRPEALFTEGGELAAERGRRVVGAELSASQGDLGATPRGRCKGSATQELRTAFEPGLWGGVSSGGAGTGSRCEDLWPTLG
jgi:hypothetical protein